MGHHKIKSGEKMFIKEENMRIIFSKKNIFGKVNVGNRFCNWRQPTFHFLKKILDQMMFRYLAMYRIPLEIKS